MRVSRGKHAARLCMVAGAALVAALLPNGSAPAAAVPGSGGSVPAAIVPAGFSDTLVASVPSPTALAFTPDGRGLVASQPGQLRLLRTDGSLVTTPVLDLAPRDCNDSERGLLGVAVDPGFATNHFLYVFWTHRTGTGCPRLVTTGLPENRVSRFTLGASGTADPASEKILIDHMPSFAGNHNAGDLHFGADGMLYVSVGDSGCQLTAPTSCSGQNANSRRLDIPLGKVLRVTRTGSVPLDNPYVGAPGARRCTGATIPPGTGPCTETWASGLRNPFRFAVRPGTSDFYVNDVGQNTTEEVDQLTRGADYGWNRCEGSRIQGSTAPCDLPGATGPLLEYQHTTGCQAITGAAFVPGSVFGAAMTGSYLYADYVCGKIFERRADGSTRVFISGLGQSSAVALTFDPFGSTKALYYLSYLGGGAVHRVARHTGNSAPVAALTVRPLNPVARSVTLDGSASYDPDSGDRITTYRWTFGDGTAATTSTPTIAHTYPGTGPFFARLVVVDTHGLASAPATRTVSPGDYPPVIKITGVDPTHRFAVGELATLTADATDREDGRFASAAIHWKLLLHHNTHTHPRGTFDATTISTVFPAPEDLAAARTSYVEARVTVTDSVGYTTTASVNLLPAKVDLTFASTPTGQTLFVRGESLTAPSTVTSWVGWALDLYAPDAGGLHCTGWSDGGACSHQIITPTVSTTYTALFAP